MTTPGKTSRRGFMYCHGGCGVLLWVGSDGLALCPACRPTTDREDQDQ